MSIKNCRNAVKSLILSGQTFARNVRKKKNKFFRVIRNYISQHPGVSVIDVSKGETGISEDKVLRFLKTRPSFD